MNFIIIRLETSRNRIQHTLRQVQKNGTAGVPSAFASLVDGLMLHTDIINDHISTLICWMSFPTVRVDMMQTLSDGIMDATRVLLKPLANIVLEYLDSIDDDVRLALRCANVHDPRDG